MSNPIIFSKENNELTPTQLCELIASRFASTEDQRAQVMREVAYNIDLGEFGYASEVILAQEIVECHD